MELRDLFEGLDAGASIALAEEIGNRMDANDTAIRVLDEFDEIIADKLLAEVLNVP
ncbi:MAG TPA: hypothetical protein VGS09_10565 [Actinomycetota bacterium]|nr:hypothetical protein [Actinomycetota bacterium]